MNTQAIARRVMARYLGKGRSWPELGLSAQPQTLNNGEVVFRFKGDTVGNRALLERLGAKWNVHAKAWEMAEYQAQRAFLTLDRQKSASKRRGLGPFTSYVGPWVRC
jgi:hypothetical protein